MSQVLNGRSRPASHDEFLDMFYCLVLNEMRRVCYAQLVALDSGSVEQCASAECV